jgi:3-oxoacyl-[acyl-carrier-protein] synthase-3
MGTIIEATATAVAQERSMAPGALESVDAAARSCLDRAGRTAGELDLLINVGVYHDKILSEPAFASLIQEDIGANLSQPPGRRARNLLVRRLQRGLWPPDSHSAG